MSVEEAIAKRRQAAVRGGSRAGRGGSGREDKKKKKASWWKIAALGIGGVTLFGGLIYFATAPKQGGATLGICKVFVERFVPYPTTLQYQFTEIYPKAVRVGYTHIDAFGQFRLDMAECAFRPDTKRGAVVDSVLVNREDLDAALVERFNAGLPAILANMPDLTLLPPLPDDILELKRD